MMHVVFLGSNYNPLSVACLCALLSVAHYQVTVGFRLQRSLWKEVRLAARRYGAGGIMTRVGLFGAGYARMVGRKLGIRLRRCETLREVMHIHQPRHIMFDDINKPEVQARLGNLRPDVILMAAFSQILPQPVLAIPKLGALNVHPSLLPKFRGPSPCYWVIKKGEKTTGVTVHQASERLDSGDIFLQREVGVLHNESHRALERRLAPIGAELLLEALEKFRTGRTVRRPQDEEEATYYSYPRLGRLEDGTGVVA